ncbi:PadR family transcriptional regulator [[Clostridium] dakarense]|uniref:PadR family transcriptional regulator n=1 Tax=Faecalimicrobium dakarense TaxID=1301100 RepID=UPI0004B37F76|nr:PadR family transcriptional regulator [[Clostridium] dakarense]
MSFQLGSALLDTCVLAVLTREDAYGYILTQQVKEVMNISESTLYPVLRRLQKDGHLITYDQSYQGRNRRYYQITDSGRKKYKEYISEWEEYKLRVDKILLGGIVSE